MEKIRGGGECFRAIRHFLDFLLIYFKEFSEYFLTLADK